MKMKKLSQLRNGTKNTYVNVEVYASIMYVRKEFKFIEKNNIKFYKLRKSSLMV